MGSLDVTPGTWALLDHLLDQALDLPEDERERWMSRLPPEHAEKLRALLASAGAAEPAHAAARRRALSPDPAAR